MLFIFIEILTLIQFEVEVNNLVLNNLVFIYFCFKFTIELLIKYINNEKNYYFISADVAF